MELKLSSYVPTKNYSKTQSNHTRKQSINTKCHVKKTRQNTTTTKNRKRIIIWFNLPYSANVVTKLEKTYKHFPSHNQFHKTFNKNTIKISCSYIPDMKTIMNSQNHKITNSKTITEERNCNCLDKAKFLLCQLHLAVLTSTSQRYGYL